LTLKVKCHDFNWVNLKPWTMVGWVINFEDNWILTFWPRYRSFDLEGQVPQFQPGQSETLDHNDTIDNFEQKNVIKTFSKHISGVGPSTRAWVEKSVSYPDCILSLQWWFPHFVLKPPLRVVCDFGCRFAGRVFVSLSLCSRDQL